MVLVVSSGVHPLCRVVRSVRIKSFLSMDRGRKELWGCSTRNGNGGCSLGLVIGLV
jgi:hypothetical protein